ncbi:MAG: ECF transporter S component [Alistipes ihumii]
MQATTVKLHSLGYEQAKTYWIAALFVAGNVLLPQLCHLVPQGGVRWLPIYFFTLIAAYKYGWRAGMLTAVASPLINSALFGMPAADTLPYSVQIVAAGRRRGLTAARCRRVSLPLLAAVVLGYQAIGTLGEWAMTGSLRAALQDFRIGLPGMSLQILGGWAFMRWILRR